MSTKKTCFITTILEGKNSLGFLFLFFSASISSVYSQAELGTGLVFVKWDSTISIPFYKNMGDSKSGNVIEIFNDSIEETWAIRNYNLSAEWLQPEILGLDFGSIVFRCKQEKDGWYEIIVSNLTGESLWIPKSAKTSFLDWEAFLYNMLNVERIDFFGQKIRATADDVGAVLEYDGQDCFQVKSMKGDWIEIFSSDYCDETMSTQNRITSGWIRWRKGNALMIQYFLSM